MNKIPVVLTCLVLVAHSSTVPAEEERQPNIVFIMADDMGVGDVSGLNPVAKIKTPNLDTLIAGGMVFTDAHTSSSVCTPTRYGLLTGRYNWRSELKSRVINGYGRPLIAPDRDTVADLLKRKGYKTAMIGKWHLGLNWTLKDGSIITEWRPAQDIERQIDFTRPFSGGPVDCGFDYWYGINASLDFPPYTWFENNRVVTIPTEERPSQGGKRVGQPELMMRSGLQAPEFRPEMVLKQMTEKAVAYIERHKSCEPFFLYFPLNAPHTPVVPREGFKGGSRCGIYGDFVQEIDWTVGQLVQTLQEQGLLENTLLVFTADNGASKASFPLEMEERFGHRPSGIYKGRKGSLDEGGHRVPFIAHWPARIEKASRCDVACNLNDLYATCAALVGEEVAPDACEDSFNMLPLFEGMPDRYQRNGMVHHDFAGRFAFRHGKWKLVTSRLKNKKALYDMDVDPSEKNNLYQEHPEIVARLEAALTKIVTDGRSTPGKPQQNDGPAYWEQLVWMK